MRLRLVVGTLVSLMLVIGITGLLWWRSTGAPGQGGDPAAGSRIFTSAGCVACHTLAAAGAKGTIGPSLDARKPTLERVVAMVTSGSGVMPSFKSSLTPQQIADVAAYVVQATGGTLPPGGAPVPTPGGPSTGPPGSTPATGPAAGPATIRLVVGSRSPSLSRRTVPAGRVQITVRNASRQRRTVIILRTDRKVRLVLARRPGFRNVPRVARVALPPHARRRLSLTLTKGRLVILVETPGRRGPRRVAVLRVIAAVQTPPTAPIIPPDPKALFTAVCGGCHTLATAGTTGAVGPNLDDEHPSRSDVIETVTRGTDSMPSFRDSLTPQQIADIATFVAASTRH